MTLRRGDFKLFSALDTLRATRIALLAANPISLPTAVVALKNAWEELNDEKSDWQAPFLKLLSGLLRHRTAIILTPILLQTLKETYTDVHVAINKVTTARRARRAAKKKRKAILKQVKAKKEKLKKAKQALKDAKEKKKTR